jgi:hypothetical protein
MATTGTPPTQLWINEPASAVAWEKPCRLDCAAWKVRRNSATDRRLSGRCMRICRFGRQNLTRYFLAPQAPHFLAAQAPHFLAPQAPHFLAQQAPHFLAQHPPHFLPAHAAAGRQRAAQPALAQPAARADAVTTAVARARERFEASEIMVMSLMEWRN